MMRRGFLCMLGSLLGCAATPIVSTQTVAQDPLAPLSTPARRHKGLILILPGIEGVGTASADVAWGLHEGGVPCAIETHEWTTGKWYLSASHLCDAERNRRAVGPLVSRIMDYQTSHPGRPVSLVGMSGGAGIAVWAAEALPPDAGLERIVLLAAALAPNYDLGPALQRTRVGVWHFHSPGDLFILGLGTLMLGTLDREYCVAAGSCGFTPPIREAKLHQIPYCWEMAATGHLGFHRGWTGRRFIRTWVAPLFCEPVLP